MSSPSPSAENGVYILAAKRTRRPDPLNSFRSYQGGWNFMDMSYLASACFTGLPGFVIGVLCLLAGVGVIVVVSCMLVCCKDHLKPTPNFDKVGNYSTLSSLVLFTMITITGCGVLFIGIEGLHSEFKTVCTYVLSQFTAAVNVSASLVPPMAAPSAAQAAEKMESATNRTSTQVLTVLDDILSLLVLCAGMLVLALIGLVFVIYHIKPVIYTLVTIGWLLVTSTWLLCGVVLLLSSVIGDTCVAMHEWADDPRPGSSFDILFKCGFDSNTSTSHFSVGVILPVADSGTQSPDYKSLNGIHHQYDESFVLKNSNDEHLNHTEKVKSIQEKAAASPSSNDTCAVFRSSFAEILKSVATYNCPGMQRSIKWVWISLVALSTGSTISICLWILFTRRSTMNLRKVDICSNQMTFGFEASNKKNDNIGAGASSINTGEEISLDMNGGGRRRAKPRQ